MNDGLIVLAAVAGATLAVAAVAAGTQSRAQGGGVGTIHPPRPGSPVAGDPGTLALRHFGRTDDLYEAGFMGPAGQLVAFGAGGQRDTDHTEIAEALPGVARPITAMQEAGWARVSIWQSGDIGERFIDAPGVPVELNMSISQPLTAAQQARVQTFFREHRESEHPVLNIDVGSQEGDEAFAGGFWMGDALVTSPIAARRLMAEANEQARLLQSLRAQ